MYLIITKYYLVILSILKASSLNNPFKRERLLIWILKTKNTEVIV